MTGYVIRCVPEIKLDFAGLSTSGQQDVVLADQIDVVQWSELTMLVRVHSHTLGSGAGSIGISAYKQSVSLDDPGLTFLDSNPQGVSFFNGTPVPAYFVLNLSALWGASPPMVRIVASGLRTGAGILAATVSLDLSVKDG